MLRTRDCFRVKAERKTGGCGGSSVAEEEERKAGWKRRMVCACR